jgi:hypothetical protein
MVVDDLHVFGVIAPPDEADPELIVDPDAVLPGSIAAERFQPVTRWGSQVPERVGSIEVDQFAAGNLGNSFEPPNAHSFEKRFRLFRPEGADHYLSLSRAALHARRYRCTGV